MRNKIAYRVTSSNFNNEYFTPSAYREIRLDMVKKDLIEHKAEFLEVELETPLICGFNPLTGDAEFDIERVWN